MPSILSYLNQKVICMVSGVKGCSLMERRTFPVNFKISEYRTSSNRTPGGGRTDGRLLLGGGGVLLEEIRSLFFKNRSNKTIHTVGTTFSAKCRSNWGHRKGPSAKNRRRRATTPTHTVHRPICHNWRRHNWRWWSRNSRELCQRPDRRRRSLLGPASRGPRPICSMTALATGIQASPSENSFSQKFQLHFRLDSIDGLGGLIPPTSENPPQICKFLKPPQILGGRPIFGLYRVILAYFVPGNPPPLSFGGPLLANKYWYRIGH